MRPQPVFLCQEGEREPRGVLGSEQAAVRKPIFLNMTSNLSNYHHRAKAQERKNLVDQLLLVFLSNRETLRPPQGFETKLHLFPAAGQTQPAGIELHHSLSECQLGFQKKKVCGSPFFK